jgi:hypothetical protein
MSRSDGMKMRADAGRFARLNWLVEKAPDDERRTSTIFFAAYLRSALSIFLG